MSLAQLLGFGKKRRSPVKKAPTPKPSAAVRRMCKKWGVKITLKRGGKRVYKSEKVLKAQCMKKKKAAAKKAPKRSTAAPKRRRSRFSKGCGSHGFGKRGKSYFGEDDDEDEDDMEFGRDDGHGSMFGSVVAGPSSEFGKRRRRATKTEMAKRRHRAAGLAMIRSRFPRYSRFGMSPGFVAGMPGRNGCFPQYSSSVRPAQGIYGTGKPFFLSTVPGPYPPEWAYHVQPDGSQVAWGAPHLGYKAPSNGLSFGKRRRRVPKSKLPSKGKMPRVRYTKSGRKQVLVSGPMNKDGSHRPYYKYA